jgi:predicted component of type VI protein secretion system
MVVKLIVASGKSAGRAISIKRSKLLVGRAEECDVRPLSEEVSRRHCSVVVEPPAVWVEDLGSRNGTFVNGERISGRTRVENGDIIRVGSLELKVACDRPEASAGGSEDDVSRWLMADSEPAGMFDTTRTLTTGVDPAPTAPAPEATAEGAVAAQSGTGSDGASKPPAAPVPVGEGASGEPVSPPTPGGSPGGLPAKPKKASESSRDAAAEALKRFFDNR